MMPAFGDLLSRAAGLYRAHTFPMLAIAAVSLPTTPVRLVAPGLDILLVVADSVISTVAFGALIRGSSVAATGGTPSIGDSFGRVVDRLSTLLAAFLRRLGAAVGLALTMVASYSGRHPIRGEVAG
jgi:hypothetical protein